MQINENRRLWEVDHKVEEVSTNRFKVLMNGLEEEFTIPMDDGEYLLEDAVNLLYNPITFITVKNTEATINVFYDDPYEREGFVCPFKKVNSKIGAVQTKDNNLEMAKEFQLTEITSGFNKEFVSGHFPSTSIGIEVDFRRTDTKNDLQNLESVISYMERYNVSTTEYKGYTESVTVSLSQLKGLKAEMEDYGLELYNRKWLKESNIGNASTIAEVKSIEW